MVIVSGAKQSLLFFFVKGFDKSNPYNEIATLPLVARNDDLIFSKIAKSVT